MSSIQTIDGKQTKGLFCAATLWLEKGVQEVNALNVFPVPDGDTGTNMFLTMRSSIEEANAVDDSRASNVVQAVAKGALMGARGNSGVILCEIWRGMAEGIKDNDVMDGAGLANAFKISVEKAYKGLGNPVEGTILTVVKETASAALDKVKSGTNDILSVLEVMVAAAKRAVADTPKQLSVLRDAGVVDAGGQGLSIILEGALYYLKGDMACLQSQKPVMTVSSIPLVGGTAGTSKEEVESPYGYCTSFTIKGENLDPDKVRRKLSGMGESLVVIGESSIIKVHIHVLNPGKVLQFCARVGILDEIIIRNMDEQVRDYRKKMRQRAPEKNVAVLAVVPGDGMADVFRSEGADTLPGGQTMNPSTRELLDAVQEIRSKNIIILPNNKNIIPVSNRIEHLTDKTIKVVPSRTIPQGLEAVLAYNSEEGTDENLENMTKSLANARTIQITRAVRPAKIGAFKINHKQTMALLDEELVAVGKTLAEVFNEAMSKVDLGIASRVTMFYGNFTREDEAERLGRELRKKYANLTVDVLRGGQPYYNFIISII
ncbi:MAG: DAK2 domain-containing protein [Candidatus Margulisiibacteriota bacterium]|nr:DAK2 domain-containing protein [Candidatus Margulisiibacteriota bacterium]